MPHNEQIAFPPRRGFQLVAMDRGNQFVRPIVPLFNLEMSKIPQERSVVISPHRNQFRSACQFQQYLLNPFAFRRGRLRCMHQIAEKHNALRPQALDHLKQLLPRAEIRQWSQLAAPPLRPAITEMHIRHERRSRRLEPQRSRRMSRNFGKYRNQQSQLSSSQAELPLERMQRIAIDMDEVSADTMSHYLNVYNAEFNQTLKKDDFHGKRIFEVIDKAHVTRSREYFLSETFFAEIPVMPGSQEVVEQLMKRYEVFITTAAMDVPNSFSAKFKWLQKNFPFIRPANVVFCGDKSIVLADFLIDDDVRHFKRFHGEGVLFTAPHNVNETRYRRVDDWPQVRSLFLS